MQLVQAKQRPTPSLAMPVSAALVRSAAAILTAATAGAVGPASFGQHNSGLRPAFAADLQLRSGALVSSVVVPAALDRLLARKAGRRARHPLIDTNLCSCRATRIPRPRHGRAARAEHVQSAPADSENTEQSAFLGAGVLRGAQDVASFNQQEYGARVTID